MKELLILDFGGFYPAELPGLEAGENGFRISFEALDEYELVDEDASVGPRVRLVLDPPDEAALPENAVFVPCPTQALRAWVIRRNYYALELPEGGTTLFLGDDWAAFLRCFAAQIDRVYLVLRPKPKPEVVS